MRNTFYYNMENTMLVILFYLYFWYSLLRQYRNTDFPIKDSRKQNNSVVYIMSKRNNTKERKNSIWDL